MPPMVWASRAANGAPLLSIPTSIRFPMPLFRSRISWARRTSVRSISEADMSCPFSLAGLLLTPVGVAVRFAIFAPIRPLYRTSPPSPWAASSLPQFLLVGAAKIAHVMVSLTRRPGDAISIDALHDHLHRGRKGDAVSLGNKNGPCVVTCPQNRTHGFSVVIERRR